MLIVSSWSEHFRSDIGLEGVSQIWGGRPAWYFWLANSPGVYQLEMMDAEEDPGTIENRCKAAFNVKCYPYQHRPGFESFSFLERKLVQSDWFDDTNTPVFEHQGDIPADLFTVARVEIDMDLEGHSTSVSFESMDYLRTLFAQETNQTFPLISRSRTFGSREVDREVPGFQMGYPLFDCLMCLYANTHNQPPVNIRFTRSPGYEFVINDGDFHARETSDIMGLNLNMFYSATGLGVYPAGNCFFGDPNEGREDIIYERHFACGHFHESKEEENLPVILNQQWWSLSHMHYESELTSSCGCH